MGLAIRRYRIAYILALSLVGALSVGGWFMLGTVIDQQHVSSELINVAGRQRILSQRVALFVEAKSGDRELDRALALMASANDRLLHMKAGGPILRLIGPDGLGRAKDLYAEVRTFIAAGHRRAPEILALSQAILPKLDRFAKDLELGAKRDVARLRRAETTVLGVTLIILFLEAVLLFRPLSKRLVRTILELKAERIRAEARRRLLTRVIAKIPDGVALVDEDGQLSEVLNGRLQERFPKAQPGVPLKAALGLDEVEDLAQGLKTEVVLDSGRCRVEAEPFEVGSRAYLLVVRDVADDLDDARSQSKDLSHLCARLDHDPELLAAVQTELGTLAAAARNGAPVERAAAWSALHETATALGLRDLGAAAERAQHHASDEQALTDLSEEVHARIDALGEAIQRGGRQSSL